MIESSEWNDRLVDKPTKSMPKNSWAELQIAWSYDLHIDILVA